MALQKQPVNINFSQGLDTKTDPKQVQVGKFLTLVNSVFDKGGALTKRNGFDNITTLPNENQTNITTLNNNLIATGSNLYSYSADTNQWFNKGSIQPVQLSTIPLIRASTSQISPDSATASNGLVCLVYVDNSVAYYQISDSATGAQILGRTAITSVDTFTTPTSPRVFMLGAYFVITYIANDLTPTPHLRFIAIPITTPNAMVTPKTITNIINGLNAGYDGAVNENLLYLSWASSSTSVLAQALNSSLALAGTATTVDGSHGATNVSVTVDISNPVTPVVWISYYDSGTTNGYTAAYNVNLEVQRLAPVHSITTTNVSEITSSASNGVLNLFYEVINYYNSTGAYPTANVRTDYVDSVTVTISGTVGSPSVVLRGVGLVSKSFVASNGIIYMLAAYGPPSAPTSSIQPSYFLIDSIGNVYMRLAYENGAGYANSQVLPSVSSNNGTYYIPYLIADLLATVSNSQTPPVGNTIYTQTGVNLSIFTINNSVQYSSAIASVLHLTGGQLWMYDGVKPVEHGFHVFPEDIASNTTSTGGFVNDQTSYYSFTYEWTDNAGNLHRSAPSIPFAVTSTGGGTSINTLYVPTLRFTYKISPNPVRIVGYRWTASQPVYYQFTGITNPVVNDVTVDYVTIADNRSNSSIFGDTILYTTGGVVEDIAAPASIHSALYRSRLVLIDAEDQNLLWYSKQVIENTPVEMSDLFTIFVAPTTGAQGSTGPCTALSAMDDKLIVFKKDAIYYITGDGPDNTGANNDFSDPVFITASVGCNNPNSIVLMPQGLMFQSDKGIWLLGRDLSTNYIGAPVEGFNGDTVLSATAIPQTNQVRFVLNSGATLMYDYYYQQWGSFTNISAISATLFDNFHTYLNEFGQIYQETPGTFTDGGNPVLMSFTTAWLSVAGLQGYERLYAMNVLGTYYTPFKLNAELAYDYNPSPIQSTLLSPTDNVGQPWGYEAAWGTGPQWGGSAGNVFSARLFPQKQKCETFQLSIQEVYDATFDIPAGQGLQLSGLLAIIGVKRGSRTQSARRSFG